MKTTLTSLFLTMLLAGCSSWSDYPHHEPSATCPDNHKSGPGLYGGTNSPTNNSPTTAPTP